MMHARMLVLAVPALIAGAVLSGCEDSDPASKASQDAKDIATVERMSREPFKPIVPKPITEMDRQRYGLDIAGCVFRKDGDDDPIFIAGSVDGFMRVGEDLKRLAAKTESAELPGNARSTYVGLTSWVDFVRQPDAGSEGDQYRWPAKLIIHDAQERVAFTANGVMTCSS